MFPVRSIANQAQTAEISQAKPRSHTSCAPAGRDRSQRFTMLRQEGPGWTSFDWTTVRHAPTGLSAVYGARSQKIFTLM